MITHFGLNEDEQRNAVQTIVENLEPERCVLMGDFNLTPDSEILKPIKEKIVDTADFCSSECLTFPSDKPYEKIDYIFVTPDIKVLSAEAVNIVASDHRPFVAELDLEIK
jgi:endonuclease/exonuclease/phosphatase family metal-dependent hydrolase